MRAALKLLPALLVPVCLAWVGAARGIDPMPWVCVATVALAIALVAVPTVGVRWSAPVVWLGALLAWASVDTVVRPVAVSEASVAVAIGIVALLLFAAAQAPRCAAWAKTALVLSGSVVAVWLLVERALRHVRPGGPFGNANPAATLVLLALALTPFLRVSMLVRGAVGVLATAAILVSGSRSAFLAVVGIGAAWVLSRRRRSRTIVAAVLVVVAAAGLAHRLATDRDPLRFERVRIWGVALKTFAAELPLGAGPSGYADAALGHNFPRTGEFARYARLPDAAESDLLQAAATLGIPGIILALGLVAALAVRVVRRGPEGAGIAAALVITSAFSTQLFIPAVAWSAALALGAVMPRTGTKRLALSRPIQLASSLMVGVTLAFVLATPSWYAAGDPELLVQRSEAAAKRSNDDGTLADAEATAAQACALRPRFGRAWRLLGDLRLQRALLRGEPALVLAAHAAFAQAYRVNSLDAWAALGEAQSLHMSGDRGGALAALTVALRLEPNSVPGWLELATVRLEGGELAAARAALKRAQMAHAQAQALAPGFVSDYERRLAWADPILLARLQEATREAR
jgi:tetratricopeptide (TPR) repeat protein